VTAISGDGTGDGTGNGTGNGTADGTGDRTADGTGDRGQLSGRAATEAALEQAATKLLERDGVLAGLNLREVADEAGVNRGLVYHYYGSRGKLLRRALRRRGQQSLSELAAHHDLPFLERWAQFFHTTVLRPDPIALTTLLMLDGSEPIRTMPLRDRTREGLRRDVAEGHLDPDVDLVALHALLVSSVFGYSLYREAFARELGIDVGELDARVDALVFKKLLGSIAALPAEPADTDGSGSRGRTAGKSRAGGKGKGTGRRTDG
jgi:AcrR family transcriptional regulator